jgi:hypothetical protein
MPRGPPETGRPIYVLRSMRADVKEEAEERNAGWWGRRFLEVVKVNDFQ